jgi:hypothetical protein
VTSTNPDPPGTGSDGSGPGARPLEPAIAVLAGLREPIVAVLLAIAFFTAISGKPVDGTLMVAVALGLAFDAGSRARKGDTAGPAGGAAASGEAAGGAAGGPGWPGGERWAGGRRRPLLAGSLVAGGVACAVVAGSFSRYSWPATAAVLAPGTLVVLIGWRGPLRHRPVKELPAAGTAVWGGLFAAGCLWELAALLQQPSLTATSYAHPTISALTDPVLASMGGRSLVLAAWLALGWYLAGR